jgi:hypothetical protein
MAGTLRNRLTSGTYLILDKAFYFKMVISTLAIQSILKSTFGI